MLAVLGCFCGALRHCSLPAPGCPHPHPELALLTPVPSGQITFPPHCPAPDADSPPAAPCPEPRAGGCVSRSPRGQGGGGKRQEAPEVHTHRRHHPRESHWPSPWRGRGFLLVPAVFRGHSVFVNTSHVYTPQTAHTHKHRTVSLFIIETSLYKKKKISFFQKVPSLGLFSFGELWACWSAGSN